MGRGAHRLLVWLGALAAALILVFGAGLWRLMQGPINLDVLTPYIQEALNRSADGLQITISGGRLGIDRETHQLDLWIEGARSRNRTGSRACRFSGHLGCLQPEIALSGVAPTRLMIQRPVLRLIRDETGHPLSVW